MKDILTDQQNALIVSQKSIEELANKLEQLLEDAPLREKLGKNGRIFVLQHYDWEIITKRYSDFLSKLSIC